MIERDIQFISDFTNSLFVHLKPNDLVFRVGIDISYNHWDSISDVSFGHLYSRIQGNLKLKQRR